MRRLLLLPLVLSLVAVAPLAPAAPAAAATDREALTGLAGRVVEAGAPGAIVARRTDAGFTAVARGQADLETGRAAAATDRYRIGSNTKTMVAVVMLQLVQEGRVGLDDPVSRLLPGLGLDERITVRHLLNQTSGFHTDTKVASPPYGYEFNRFHYFEPEKLVEIALTNTEPRAEPGKQYEYSNTNYVLAGLVIERVTHNPVQVELQRRIFGPLKLRDTSFPAYNPVIFGRHLSGYLPADGEPPYDTTVYSMSWVWSAGAVISTVQDETTFMRALFHGKLLSKRMFAEMTEPGPNGQYAMGLVKLPLACAPGGFVWGHDGIVFGYLSSAFSTADGSIQTAAVGNAWILDDNGAPSSLVTQVGAVALCGDTAGISAVDETREALEDVPGGDVAHP
ncbi:serine hydrolase domain-containing protein [Flindersiella endophytica]